MSSTPTQQQQFSDKNLKDAQSKTFTIVDQTTLCVECLDHRAALKCLQCDDQYCDLCFAQLHRFGFRALHKFEMLEGLDINTVHLNQFALPTESTDTTIATSTTTTVPKPVVKKTTTFNTSNIHTIEDIPTHLHDVMIFYPNFGYRVRYIPLRLNDYERKLLHILESALNISEYTDKVDILQHKNREATIVNEIAVIYHLISSLYISGDFKKGVKKFLTEGKNDYVTNAQFFQHVFEIGRRHKIRNPDKLRSGYGKLMAIVSDSKLVRHQFGFDLGVRIRSVSDRCKQWGILDMLSDPLIIIASSQIDVQSCTSKEYLQEALEIRNYASKTISHKYATIATAFVSDPNYPQLDVPRWIDDEITPKKVITSEDILLLIQSISDAHNYLYQGFTPLTKMSKRLETLFKPPQQVLPIDIRNGVDGSRLTHSTESQYQYIHQTYFLWRQIMLRMYSLWYAADSDLLGGYSESDGTIGYTNLRPVSYQLRFTDQGITRMQSCPAVGSIMGDIMSLCFRHFDNHWVGSSAVHLGDINVPNALSFIDKYTQLERILSPLDRVLYQIEQAWDDNTHLLHQYMIDYYKALGDNSTTPIPLQYRILQDYFRHAFNGSGADNYNSAGSCIDGRLTSSWEWCNILSKKSYHQAFLISGFIGWDG